jgi:1,2-diacylglycerol 3-alpha-glucosyltransferase
MRILMASHGYPPVISGVTLVVQKLARAMARQGHDVAVVTASKHGAPNESRDEGVRVIRVQSVPNPFWEEAPIPYAGRKELEEIMIDLEPEVIHSHEAASLALAFLWVRREIVVPLIATCHYVPGFFTRYVMSRQDMPLLESLVWHYSAWLFNQFDHVVFPTGVHRDLYVRQGLTAPTAVISNGINSERYHPGTDGVAEAEAGYHLPAGPRILFVSRLAKDKKIDVLIEAMQHIHLVPEAHLVLAGRGDEQENLETLVATLQLEPRVHFLGFVPEEDMPALYRAADLFAIASTYEVQSLPTLQAAASGLPIVAANAVALPELVHDGINGFLVPPDDPVAMAEAIDRILNDPDLAARLGQAGRSLALAHAEESTFSSYENLYREVISRSRSRAWTAR